MNASHIVGALPPQAGPSIRRERWKRFPTAHTLTDTLGPIKTEPGPWKF